MSKQKDFKKCVNCDEEAEYKGKLDKKIYCLACTRRLEKEITKETWKHGGVQYTVRVPNVFCTDFFIRLNKATNGQAIVEEIK